jgi:hypothetical protein
VFVVPATRNFKYQKEAPMERELTVQERAAEVGLTMARLARESHVRYWKIHLGYELDRTEEEEVAKVIDRYAFRRRIHHDRAAV